MTDHIRTLSELASTRISCYPNAGLPNEEGKYLETPESLAASLRSSPRTDGSMFWRMLWHHACHIRPSLRWRRANAPPIPPPAAAFYSGIELVEARSPTALAVGERTNVIAPAPSRT